MVGVVSVTVKDHVVGVVSVTVKDHVLGLVSVTAKGPCGRSSVCHSKSALY